MPFVPGAHATSRQLEPLYEDVPDHLKHQLWTWLEGWLKANDSRGVARIRKVANHMRWSYGSVDRTQYSNLDGGMRAYIERSCKASGETMLQVIEYMLADVIDSRSAGEHLEEHLRLGNSAYAVREDGKALEMRVEPAVRDQVQATVDAAVGSAGDHLANAWNEAYGMNSDPVKSYRESVMAVEAALALRITPQNDKQTLGTMIADVRNAPQNFEFVIPDGDISDGIETVLFMMRQLWEGQTRHGGARPTRDETLEEAQAAVHIAAALVQYGITGSFKRK